MCFEQEGAISILSGKTLKVVDQFTYLGIDISSTESDVNIGIAKVRTSMDTLTVIWKSDLSEKK